MIKPALEPVPPDIESGAGVVALPMKTELSESELRITFPLPLGASVKLSSLTVPIVTLAPPPKLKAVAEIASVAAELILVKPVALSMVSEFAIVKTFDPESITMSPVVTPPIVNVWALVVPRFPVPVKYVALSPLFAEMDAVGVPVPTLTKPNLADALELPPSKKSCEMIRS
jgi:hypothetical protein